MKSYIGKKVVLATPMTRGEYNKFRGWQLPADEDASDEGYLVEYTDGGKPNVAGHKGYVSWSPKEQFDGGYTDTDSPTASFDLALHAVKSGMRIARKGWNGKGVYAYYVPAAIYDAQTDVAKAEYPNGKVPYRAYLALKTAQGDVAVWTPSCSDILADDWYLV